MNQKQKSFILDQLIPFVLRDQGKGFDMDYWLQDKSKEDSKWWWDKVEDPPQCGIIACLGGSIEILLGKERSYLSTLEATGLSYDQQQALFYGWQGGDADGSWPAKYVESFREAETKLERAQVACGLLREIVRTEGACLLLPLLSRG